MPTQGRRASIEWAPAAVEDLSAALRYLRPRNRDAARRLVTRVLDAVERLVDQPEAGATVDDLEPVGHYRQLVVGSYRVIYRVGGAWVYVLRVWDGRRDPGALDLFDGAILK